jgi:hypothetical protein
MPRILGDRMVHELLEIARLRADGARRLRTIAEEFGAGSILYRCCREVWLEREAGADLSVVSGDLGNAITLLQGGLHLLRYGPEVLRKDRLPLDDALSLLRAA